MDNSEIKVSRPGFLVNSYIDEDYREQYLTEKTVLIIPDKLPVRFTVLGVKTRVEVGEWALIPAGYLLQINSKAARRVVEFNNLVLNDSSFTFLKPVLGCPAVYHAVNNDSSENEGVKNNTFSGYTTHLIPEQIIGFQDVKKDESEHYKNGQLNGAQVALNLGTLTLEATTTLHYTADVRLEGLRLSPLTLANDLWAYGMSEDPFREAKFQATLISLYSILGEEIIKLANYSLGDGGYKSVTYEKLAMAVDYCHNHFREQFTLGDISKYCGVARNYLSALFKDFYKIAFYDYLLRLRADEAAKLLLTTDKPVGVIAKEAGFNSDATFGRVFKNYNGMSPREYRKLK